MEFEGGLTASFSMVAFTEEICKRKTTIYGSKVGLEGTCLAQKKRARNTKTEEIRNATKKEACGKKINQPLIHRNQSNSAG